MNPTSMLNVNRHARNASKVLSLYVWVAIIERGKLERERVREREE